MNIFLTVLPRVFLFLLIIALLLWIILNIRARKLSNEFGSFRCWARPDIQAGWTSGIGMYGTETLTWYRLVGFSRKPVYTLPRRGLEVSAPQPHCADGSIVEVRLVADEERLFVLIEPKTYNGLVSWVESGLPAEHR
ncbi:MULTISPECIES: DUF2550 family protein [unclassified Schaalia]|uniref:DUF2550 family protein n=1 Tax=unclassified Schaalia TaxID=2691889 RepID=UPI001E35AE73|nr:MULTISPECIES: DUF2550 family protein [unclassified Schaalia]MCD4549641.1 DUF2550 domain-containing protein [Schaalia sp. lx-260]MCD4556704.1 DUF2550 domain-containing protein [Schaalia sp. lx-100]